MRRLLVVFITSAILLWSSFALAAGVAIHISIAEQNDGITYGELLYDDRTVWRLAILADGAKPATSVGAASNTTFLTPDIFNGMFLLKVY